MNILIAYFSHGGENLVDGQIINLNGNGNTKRAAETLNQELAYKGVRAALHEIQPLVPYPTAYSECNARCRAEHDQDIAPAINDGPTHFDAYDVIFLGYPNWYGTIPGPVVSFLRSHNFEGKTIIPFVTHGGQRFLYSLSAIQAEAPKANVIEGFAISASYMDAAPRVVTKWIGEHESLIK
ncbi:MAG: NAD(P)H-dependent oxidoreductase [Bacilli bacterium]|nr:NAD(P)H-dependent oxidoreductase [Bacilli bacterium]